MSTELTERINNDFVYHEPTLLQIEKYEALRNKAKMLAHFINELCPDSREKSLSLTSLEQAVMWANAAIARNE